MSLSNLGMGELLGLAGILVTILIALPMYFVTTRKKTTSKRINIDSSNINGDVVGGDKISGNFSKPKRLKK